MASRNLPDFREILDRISGEGMREAQRNYFRWMRVRNIARGNRLEYALSPAWEPEELRPASVLTIEARPEGDWFVRIDLRKCFTVPPVLGALLRILSADTGKSNDGLVGWKTFDAIVAEMRASGESQRFTRHALSEAVLRLRKILERHAYDPRLIQTSRPRRAYRFAIALPQADTIPLHSSGQVSGSRMSVSAWASSSLQVALTLIATFLFAIKRFYT